jgi:hypothetical protein
MNIFNITLDEVLYHCEVFNESIVCKVIPSNEGLKRYFRKREKTAFFE